MILDKRLSKRTTGMGVVEDEQIRRTMTRGQAEPEETVNREPASAGLKNEFLLVLAASRNLGAGVPCTAEINACVLDRMRDHHGQQQRQQHPPK